MPHSKSRFPRPRLPLTFVGVMLAIEFLDEYVFGIRQAAWPLIRDELNLSYIQIGLLLSLPDIVSAVIEPFIGIYGDIGYRRRLILGGGVGVAICLTAIALTPSFALLLGAFIVWYPASGAFVSLAQASLMDHDEHRHEQNMARWAFTGSLASVLGSASLPFFVALTLGWRELFILSAAVTLLTVWIAYRLPAHRLQGTQPEQETDQQTVWHGIKQAWHALKRREVLRWLILLEFSDLMLDVLFGYLALYAVDVAGVTSVQAGVAVVVWLTVGVAGDFLLIPLLERVRGLIYLRFSVIVELALYPTFLLVESWTLKLVLLALLGFFNAGWYSILKGQLYSTMRGQSGLVVTLGSLAGYMKAGIPLLIGVVASSYGLNAAMWLLIAGPIALLFGLFRAKDQTGRREYHS